MVKRMLIDATHSEETRVVVLSGNRLEEFDFETSTKKQLKGNIYLAKVTRVEPSLQAAFVDYGGNRHGFLAFSEIHPDYYRIPVEDRQALLAESDDTVHDDREDTEETDQAETPDGDDADEVGSELDEDASGEEAPDGDDAEDGEADDREPGSRAADDAVDDSAPGDEEDKEPETSEEAEQTAAAEEEEDEDEDEGTDGEKDEDPKSAGDGDNGKSLETVGGDDDEDIEKRNRRFQRRYRIQEVISRRQILLVQVTKEERGNKGAALTTYISLAGRYCVLMPNTPRGGGISRKISNPADRKKLKTIVEDLDIPSGMAVIVRTAGSKRTKAEIRRDYDFLIRLWDEIRETTLSSTAPALVYEEADLIKRSMRDLYSKDIDEIFVEGDDGYKAARAFMKQLIPSHAKRIQAYTDSAMPLFHRYQVESQLDSIHSPTVQLKSGGYIVMNSTEALVAIDVNSGKSTRERNIEETAYRTNLEAAEEIARQLRLRDLAGLIVIDFIDMEESRNRHNVERKLKEAMRSDRARIQLGRISPFGLLELSRQRLRPSLLEASAQPCPTCAGTGVIRSTESTALHVLRAIEEEGMRQRSARLTLYVPTAVAFYMLNQKRDGLRGIEERYGFEVYVEGDDSLVPPDYRLERESGDGDEEDSREQARSEPRRERSDRDRSERGRRRGGRRRRDADDTADTATEATEAPEEVRAEEGGDRRRDDSDQEQRETRGRRRGRRGGRRRRRGRDRDGEVTSAAAADADADADENADRASGGAEASEGAEARDVAQETESTGESAADAASVGEDASQGDQETKPAAKPRRRSRRRSKAANGDADTVAKAPDEDALSDASGSQPLDAGAPDSITESEPAPASDGDAPKADDTAEEAPAKKPRRRRSTRAKATSEENAETEAAPAAETPPETGVDDADAKPKAKAPRRKRRTAAEIKADKEAKEAAKAKDAAKKNANGADTPKEAPAELETQSDSKPTAAGEADANPTAKSEVEAPAVSADAAAPEPEAKPKKRRRGWWSLGG